MRQRHLSYSDSVNLGSFYTPYSIVRIAYRLLSCYVEDFGRYVILDSSCGSGNFFNEKVGAFKNIGIDIDAKAIEIARTAHPHVDYYLKNALNGVSRDEYCIEENQRLIIVGNPPYNDKTSQIQKNIKRCKEKGEIDKELDCRDIGISFLRSYAKLKPDFICILHPLSYLLKKTNFNLLKDFIKEYKIIDSLIIDSKIFCPRSSFSFPIIIGVYQRNSQGMSFEYIKNFQFKIKDNETFSIQEYDFIGNYIDKYPNRNRIKKTDAIAMFYTMRDINALKRSKTFIDEDIANSVYVTKEKYGLYCYVDVFKHFAQKLPFYFGNLDIIINYKEFKTIEEDFIVASKTKIIGDKIKLYFKKLFGKYLEDPMRIENVDDEKIYITIPLTQTSGKSRVKIRNSFYEYGIPASTRQQPFTQKHYIEWQIGYDVEVGKVEKMELTTLKGLNFIASNTKQKALYELSEYAYYFYQKGIIQKTELNSLFLELSALKNEDMVDYNFRIERSYPTGIVFHNMSFYASTVKYPLLVYNFGNFDILIEIIIREKQYAIGVQPMLYVCFPVTELNTNEQLLGRTAKMNECATLVIDRGHKDFILGSLKIFGMLSVNHNYDICQILQLIMSSH